MKVNVQISAADYRRLSDEELVRRYTELREPEPLYHLYDRYGHIVYGVYVKRYNEPLTAKNHTEELFTGLTKELLNVQITDFKQWLYDRLNGNTAAATNTAKKETIKNNDQKDDVNITTAYLNTPEVFDQALASAFVNLPPKERTCLELFYAKEQTYEAIAQETGMTVADVRRNLRAGYATLKTDLKPLFNRNV